MTMMRQTLSILATALLFACSGGSDGPQAPPSGGDSQTHFSRCTSTDASNCKINESCVCERCTITCSDDVSCGGYENAACSTAAEEEIVKRCGMPVALQPRVCVRQCTEDADCENPPGATHFACSEGHCLPSPCGAGACVGGVEINGDDGSASTCSTDPLAQDESCDGIDNDCDGDTDEDFALGETCGTGHCSGGANECLPSGALGCSRMPGGSEDASSEERCDGIDNDCDGDTDEGFPLGESCEANRCADGVWECSPEGELSCAATTTRPGIPIFDEACDGEDNDCDGDTDEDFPLGQPCRGQGACGVGIIECDLFGDIQCSTAPAGSDSEATIERCDDIDNDCDGLTDEIRDNACGGCGGLDGFVGESCTPSTADDPNRFHTLVCSDDGNALNCVPDADRFEVCNGIDDDNDGLTDEAPDGGTLRNACGGCTPLFAAPGTLGCSNDARDRCGAGTWACAEGGEELRCIDAVPAFEQCGGGDEDCDGAVDEVDVRVEGGAARTDREVTIAWTALDGAQRYRAEIYAGAPPVGEALHSEVVTGEPKLTWTLPEGEAFFTYRVFAECDAQPAAPTPGSGVIEVRHWESLSPVPTYRELRSIAFDARRGACHAAGDAYVYAADCENFEERIVPGSPRLRAVAVDPLSGDAFLGGEAGLILRWPRGAAAPVPEPVDSGDSIEKLVSCAPDPTGASYALALTQAGDLLRRGTSGEGWVRVITPATQPLRDVACVGLHAIAGGAGATVIVSHDGAADWQVAWLGESGQDIAAVAIAHAWLMWAGGVAGTEPLLIRSEDGGESWRDISEHAQLQDTEVVGLAAAPGATTLWIQTDATEGFFWRPVIYRVPLHGRWVAGTVSPAQPGIQSVAALPDRLGGGFVGAGRSGRIVRTRDARRTRSEELTYRHAMGVSAVAFFTREVGMLMGPPQYTDTAGATWRRGASEPQGPAHTSDIDVGANWQAVQVSSQTDGRVCHTRNRGLRWLCRDGNPRLESIHLLSDLEALGSNLDGIFYTPDVNLGFEPAVHVEEGCCRAVTSFDGASGRRFWGGGVNKLCHADTARGPWTCRSLDIRIDDLCVDQEDHAWLESDGVVAAVNLATGELEPAPEFEGRPIRVSRLGCTREGVVFALDTSAVYRKLRPGLPWERFRLPTRFGAAHGMSLISASELVVFDQNDTLIRVVLPAP